MGAFRERSTVGARGGDDDESRCGKESEGEAREYRLGYFALAADRHEYRVKEGTDAQEDRDRSNSGAPRRI